MLHVVLGMAPWLLLLVASSVLPYLLEHSFLGINPTACGTTAPADVICLVVELSVEQDTK